MGSVDIYSRWEEQVKKNVEKRGIKWMEMTKEETWNDRDRWGFCPNLDPQTIGETRLGEEEEEQNVIFLLLYGKYDINEKCTVAHALYGREV